MAINLGSSSNTNNSNTVNNVDENGLRINTINNISNKVDSNGLKINKTVTKSTLPTGKNTRSSKKKSYLNLLDDGYQFGDLTKMFLGETKTGTTNLMNTIANAPSNIKTTTKNILNESEALKDGYQLGDGAKTLGSTLLSTGQIFGEGIIRDAEHLFDNAADLTGGLSDRINTKLEKAVGLHKGKTESEVNKEKAKSRKDMIKTNYTDALMKAVGKDDEYKDTIESNSIIKTDNMGGAIAQEVGRQALNLLAANKLSALKLPNADKIGNAAINLINKGITSAPLMASSYGSGLEEAYQNGATTSEARRYGVLNAATETATEWVTGGIPGLKGTAGKGLDGLASKIIGEPIESTSKSLAKALLKSGYKLVGEGTEEALSELINPYIKQFTYEYNNDKNVLGNLSEATSKISPQDMITSFIIGAITAGIIDAPNTISDIKSGYINGRNNNVSTNNSNVINNNEIGTDLNEIQSSNINNQEIVNPSQNGLNISNNNLLNNNINTLSKVPYQYTNTDNQKINNLKQSASQYLDNSTQTQNLINTYEKIIKDKNYNVLFDNTITNKDGNPVNAQIKTLSNGEVEIKINPNSNCAGEFLIMHEVTHAIETNSMKELVLDYASKNQEFNQALESLKITYGTEDVSSEVLSDISGQLFGNQEFINELSMKQPNIFKKIYNKIIELANKITGNSKESLFIKDLKNKWETAYKTQNNNLKNDVDYSTIGLNGASNLEKNSTDRYYKNLYKGQKNAEIIHTNSNNDLETANIKSKQETGWFKTKYSDWGTLITDKKAKLIKKIEPNKTYKLGDILEHNLLYQAYPELKKLKVETSNINATAQISKYKNLPINEYTVKIYLNNNDLNKKDFKNSLLHEINHYIEMKEGYNKNSIGANTNYKNKADYKNNLGEIISNEAKIYSDFTQKELDDIILPEQAKNNPKYKNIEEKLKKVNKNDRYIKEDDTYARETNQNLLQNKFKDNSLANRKSSNNNRIEDFYDNEGTTNDSSFYYDKTTKQHDDLDKYIFDDEFYKQFENEDKTKIIKSIDELQQEFNTIDEDTDDGWVKGYHIRQQIRALENGYNSEYDYIIGREKDRLSNDYERGLLNKRIEEKKKRVEKNKQLQQDINESTPLQKAQYEVIQKTNPAPENSNYVWIRSPKDIKTFAEVINDKDSFTWGDYSKEDALRDLEKGTVTIYSSYPIKNGVFVSTSYQQALDYAGGDQSQVRSRKVLLNSVAWINGDEGQYAKVYDIKSYTKYSQDTTNNKSWREHLESNYKSTGTRTNLNSLKLPTANIKKDTSIKADKLPKVQTQETKPTIKEINQKKIDNNTNAINRLTQEKSDMISRFKEKIKNKKELLKSKSNQDTKLATNLNIQISNLNNQMQNRILEYDKKIDYYKNKNDKMNTEEFKIQEQRLTKKQEYIDEAYKLTENMVEWKDKNTGASYKINTMKRNLYDIMPKADADRVYNTYFQPITESNAKSEKFIASYNKRIDKFKLTNKESTAVQMLGEYKYNKETLVTGPQIDAYISDNHLDYDKISNAVEEFRNIYDELIVETNKVLKEQGYKEIEYRKGYFPHFQEETRQGKFFKLAEKLGFNVSKNSQTLPTDIAGITDMFKPGKTYFKNAQQRKGKTTDYNALKGYDNYIRGAADVIFYTEDIQKLRALENVLRVQYTDSSIQERLEKIYNDENLDQDQKQRLVDEEYLKIDNPLPNFVTELRDYTDNLANKKDVGDRGMEHMLGRETYTIMKDVQSRVSANMIGFNISSALTNFIPITQAYGEVSTKNMFKAIRESISNQVRSDGFADCSTYLINRTKQADRLYKTTLDNINSKAGVVFEAIDSITSNVIVRGKYYDNIDKGMSQESAIKNANEFAKDIMAGRSKGDMPTIFNRKSPAVKLVTAFQLEVNNQYGYMLKDLPRNLSDEAKSKIVGAFIKMFVGAWLYNKFSEAVTGRESAFSPIDLVSDSIKTVQQENTSAYDKISSIFTNIAEELPFIGGLLGGGRLPIQSAIPDVGTTVESITQLGDSDKRKTAIKNLTKELSKPLFYVALPFGGGQLKKTIEGASMYTRDVAGSYTSSGSLRFTADKDFLSVTKNVLFGQYSSKNALEYFDNGYAPLDENQIKEFKELNVSMNTYRKYRSHLSEINEIKSDKDSKGNSISGTSTAKKAYQIMNSDEYSEKEKNYLLNNISSSKNKITISDLNKISNDEDIYKYYFSLSSDSKEEYINAIENYNFDSYELYDYYKTKKQYENDYVSSKSKELIINYLVSSDLSDIQKKYLYSKDYGSSEAMNLIDNLNVNIDNYLNTVNYVNNIKDSYQGTQYTNYRKQQIFQYIQGLNATIAEKIILFKLSGYSITSYKSYMYDYINDLNINAQSKANIWNQLY